jgi:hypothetical protein
MARRLFIYDKTLGTTVEITPTRRIETAPTILVKNLTANKKRRDNTNTRWPMVSENAGCQPEQVAEANANCRKMGIAAEYLPTGDVVWSSPKAKRDHIRSIGLHDRSAYY